jgi:hypothetical protein
VGIILPPALLPLASVHESATEGLVSREKSTLVVCRPQEVNDDTGGGEGINILAAVALL